MRLSTPVSTPTLAGAITICAKLLFLLVQLGGLEPPTSCSTDRRSNQLSYNCILGRPQKKGARTRRKLCATPVFGKAGRQRLCVVPANVCRTMPDFLSRTPPNSKKARAHRPGFFWHRTRLDQAAGLNSFEALFLIGSAVSVATFLVSSVSFFLLAV